ncbi:hypothetical protein F5880DRAFT_1628023 [Lentinula raphanica]|nr:hypothetical protein F5880DRAFT_1628023 [Lentinula raphanica]
MITIPVELMKAGQYFHNIPLPFFTNDALTRIEMLHQTMPKTKFQNGSKSDYVLDIKAVGKQLGIDVDDPMLLEDLSFEEFKEAAENFCEYELKRSREKEAGNRFIFASQHFAYFLNQDQPWKSYRYWKPEEFKLREQRAMFNYPFAMVNYNRAWDRAMHTQQLDEMRYSIQEEVLFHFHDGQFNASGGGLAKSRFSPYPIPSSSDQKPAVFSLGGKTSRPASCCLGCGKRGHRTDSHSVDHDGEFIWALWINDQLCSPEHGHNRVCMGWNIYGRCGSGCDLEHVCSLCGSDSHHARRRRFCLGLCLRARLRSFCRALNSFLAPHQR